MINQQKNTASVAVASLVLGILGLILIGPLGAIPAIICGHLARTKIKQNPQTLTGDGLAVAGLILGYITLVLSVVITIVYFTVSAANAKAGEESENTARIAISRSAVGMIAVAIDLYESDNGQLPTSLNNLIVKGNESNWNGPYVRKTESLLDGWGSPLDYKPNGNIYSLVSAGPDQIIGTSDDIQ